VVWDYWFCGLGQPKPFALLAKLPFLQQMAEAWATADKILWAGKAEEANRLVDAAKLSAEKES